MEILFTSTGIQECSKEDPLIVEYSPREFDPNWMKEIVTVRNVFPIETNRSGNKWNHLN